MHDVGVVIPRFEIRSATADDRAAIADMAAELAMSLPFSHADFDVSFPALLADEGACVLIAVSGTEAVGYLLGLTHLTFYANGPVGWVEEVLVRPGQRERGIGRALMSAFERWAAGRGCALVALATRRALPFYLAIGYDDSAVYLRKFLH
jgi:GNAT superfamily N-acetyltransferase